MLRIKEIIEGLGERLFFTISDIADVLGITRESARVLAVRYTKMGIFTRIKRDIYVLSQNFKRYTKEEMFRLSNFLQVPSYLSFLTALDFYGITTQVQRDFFESACIKRTKSIQVNGITFNYYKLKREYYYGFINRNGIFIATKEKAFVDAVYLYTLGLYSMDWDAIDFGKLEKEKVESILRIYPEKTGRVVKRIWRN